MEVKKQPLTETKTTTTVSAKKMVLDKENYYLILLGVVVIIIGFILMSGGRYENPEIFNPEELYSTRRTVIAPIVVILGFVIEIYALFHKSKKV